MFIKVYAQPGAKREQLVKKKENVLTISVKEPARGNRANKRITELIALYYNTAPSSVRLISGHRSRSKMFSL